VAFGLQASRDAEDPRMDKLPAQGPPAPCRVLDQCETLLEFLEFPAGRRAEDPVGLQAVALLEVEDVGVAELSEPLPHVEFTVGKFGRVAGAVGGEGLERRERGAEAPLLDLRYPQQGVAPCRQMAVSRRYLAVEPDGQFPLPHGLQESPYLHQGGQVVFRGRGQRCQVVVPCRCNGREGGQRTLERGEFLGLDEKTPPPGLLHPHVGRRVLGQALEQPACLLASPLDIFRPPGDHRPGQEGLDKGEENLAPQAGRWRLEATERLDEGLQSGRLATFPRDLDHLPQDLGGLTLRRVGLEDGRQGLHRLGRPAVARDDQPLAQGGQCPAPGLRLGQVGQEAAERAHLALGGEVGGLCEGQLHPRELPRRALAEPLVPGHRSEQHQRPANLGRSIRWDDHLPLIFRGVEEDGRQRDGRARPPFAVGVEPEGRHEAGLCPCRLAEFPVEQPAQVVDPGFLLLGGGPACRPLEKLAYLGVRRLLDQGLESVELGV